MGRPLAWIGLGFLGVVSLALIAINITTMEEGPQFKQMNGFTYFGNTSSSHPSLKPACFLQSGNLCIVGAATNERNEQVICWGPMNNMICNNTFRSYLRTACNGRLGNVMMAYATMFYFYRYGFNAILDSYQFSVMNRNFIPDQFVIKEGVQTYPHMPFDVNGVYIGHNDDVGDIDYNDFIPKMDNYRLNMSLDVGVYPTPFNLFKLIINELKDQFQFRPEIMQSATEAIRLSVQNVQAKFANRSMVIVAVHFRRGDYLNAPHLQDIYSGDIMFNYFMYCISKFRERYDNSVNKTVFLLISDDPQWMKDKFGNLSDTAFPQQFAPIDGDQMPGRDMAIFSLCHHVIRSWGTYGLWGALLSGGFSMYPRAGRANRDERHIDKMQNLTNWEPVDIFQFFPITTQPTSVATPASSPTAIETSSTAVTQASTAL